MNKVVLWDKAIQLICCIHVHKLFVCLSTSPLYTRPLALKPCLELLGSVTASLEGGVAIIDLHSNHRSSQSDLQQVLEHNLSLLIKSYQQKVINELVVYECIWSHRYSKLSTALSQHWLVQLCLCIYTSSHWQSNHCEKWKQRRNG